MNKLLECLHEAMFRSQYVFWVWLVIVFTAVLVILAALLGADLLRDWRNLNRVEKDYKPRRA